MVRRLPTWERSFPSMSVIDRVCIYLFKKKKIVKFNLNKKGTYIPSHDNIVTIRLNDLYQSIIHSIIRSRNLWVLLSELDAYSSAAIPIVLSEFMIIRRRLEILNYNTRYPYTEL